MLLLVAVAAELVQRPTLPSPPPARPGPSDMTIIPGQRVDFITIGLTIPEVESRLGKGTIRPARESRVHLFPEAGVSLSTQDGQVTSILVRNPHFSTRNSIEVGGDVDLVIRTFGQDYEWEGDQSSYQLHYWQQGIHFGVTDDVVESIQVTAPLR